MSDYYIVSLKWTRPGDPYVSFWRANDSGYAWPLAWAGRYDSDRVLARPQYYHNEDSTIAVRCDAVEAIAVPPAPGTVDNDAGPVVPNTPATWQVLRENGPIIEEPVEHG